MRRSGQEKQEQGVANINEKTGEARLRLGHVVTTSETDRGSNDNMEMEVSGHHQIGIPKFRWRDVIQKYIEEAVVQRVLRIWRMRPRCADHK